MRIGPYIRCTKAEIVPEGRPACQFIACNCTGLLGNAFIAELIQALTRVLMLTWALPTHKNIWLHIGGTFNSGSFGAVNYNMCAAFIWVGNSSTLQWEHKLSHSNDDITLQYLPTIFLLWLKWQTRSLQERSIKWVSLLHKTPEAESEVGKMVLWVNLSFGAFLPSSPFQLKSCL